MLRAVARRLVQRAERRLGVGLDYVHEIARIDIRLLARYNRVFGFLDPNRHSPVAAYHVARLRGALAADCGTCVEIEVNLATKAGMEDATIDATLAGRFDELPDAIAAVARLTDAVVNDREDEPSAREIVRNEFGEAGLVELAFAMNGAALLPGIKRAMGYATACDVDVLRRKHAG